MIIMSKNTHAYLRPNMSLFVPSVTATTSETQVKQVFHNLNIGLVSRVDFVEKEQNPPKLMAFIHFDYWYITDTSYYLQEKILETGQTKIVYNDPYYWIVRENKTPRTLTEIQLEKEVDDLKKRVAYLDTVIGNHTRKFMENDISTTKVYCQECTSEMERETQTCGACGLITKKDEELSSEFWKDMEKDSNLKWCDMEDTEEEEEDSDDDDDESDDDDEYIEGLETGLQEEGLETGLQEEGLETGLQEEGLETGLQDSDSGSQKSGWFWW